MIAAGKKSDPFLLGSNKLTHNGQQRRINFMGGDETPIKTSKNEEYAVSQIMLSPENAIVRIEEVDQNNYLSPKDKQEEKNIH
jgi:hypothetical protein